MTQRFAELLRSRCRVEPGSTLLIGVSGGADSVALLRLLLQLAEGMRLRLQVAHLDHGLRSTSGADARWVEELCERFGLSCVKASIDVARLAQRQSKGLEETAREARHAWLQQQAVAAGCDLIALGHHAGDQAETMLMRLLRGTGPAGLGGMAFRSGKLIRPLLDFPKQALEDYLVQIGQPWLTDSSNRDQQFTRNRIRHQLLPALQQYNPHVETALCRLASQLRLDDDCLEGLAARLLDQCCSEDNGVLSVPVKILLESHPSQRGRMVRGLLGRVRGDLAGLSSSHVEAVCHLLTSERPQASLDLPGAWVARRYETLVMSAQKPQLPVFAPIVIPGPGEYPLPDGGQLSVMLVLEAAAEDDNQVEFAADEIDFPLRLRQVAHGDRFRPSGMPGRKKLQDYFVDIKLPKESRASSLVVEGDEILWLVGRRRCEGFKPEVGKVVLRLALKR